jgi:hypothetical protein
MRLRSPSLAGMSFRILSAFMAALALMLVPLAMTGGQAMAHGAIDATAAVDHCGDKEGPAKPAKSGAKAACANACAGCIAALPQVDTAAPLLAAATGDTLIAVLAGVSPERETPPPRARPEI